ncbi:MAG: leucine-rich repeat protein [Lachnospiraceae bacterium]|nr:leucine-rich repeat protein [Lachnospiraceae bacterium]
MRMKRKKRSIVFLLICAVAFCGFTEIQKAAASSDDVIASYVTDQNVWARLYESGELDFYEGYLNSNASIPDLDDDSTEYWRNPDKIAKVKSVVFNEGNSYHITRIGNNAFRGCTNLTSVSISDSIIQSIGRDAFNGCTKIKEINLPSAISSVDANAFRGTSNSLKLRVASANGSAAKAVTAANSQNVFYVGKDSDFALRCDNDGTVTLVRYTGTSTTVTLPSYVNVIGSNAFRENTALTKITIPASVRSMESSVFRGCTGLTTVLFSGTSTLGRIPDYAFEGCSSLSNIAIPDSVTNIQNYAFRNCTSLASLYIPDSVTEVRNTAFYGADGLKIHVSSATGDTAKAVSGAGNFYVGEDTEFELNNDKTDVILKKYTGNAENVTIPEYINALASGVFSGNTTIKNVVMTGVTKTYERTFFNCTSLETVIINEGLVMINTKDFSGCSALRSVVIPETVTDISDSAFENDTIVCLMVGCNSYAKEWAVTKGFAEASEDETNNGRHYKIYHNCGETLYLWNDDNTSVTAVRSCIHNDGYEERETVRTTFVQTAPTATEAGMNMYTVVFANPAFKPQNKMIRIYLISVESDAGCNVTVTAYDQSDTEGTVIEDGAIVQEGTILKISVTVNAGYVLTIMPKEEYSVTDNLKIRAVSEKIEPRWEKIGNRWKYYDEFGESVKSQWKQIEGKTYCFDIDGYMQTGWYKEGDEYYYFKSNGALACDEWVEDGRYYVDEEGKWIKGKVKEEQGTWKQNSKGWWYQNADKTYPKAQWKKIDGKWYHFDEEGYRQTGWYKEGNIYYYLKEDGSLASDEWVENEKYYIDADGKWVEGKEKDIEQGVWKQNDKGWWYKNSDGTYPKSEWKNIDGKWYHFDEEGYRQTGWYQEESIFYYFKTDGTMACDEWVEDDKYYLDASGKWIRGKVKEEQTDGTWKKDSKGWWYQNADGTYPKNQWKKISGKWYHFDENGYMQTGWYQEGNTYYFLKSDGSMACDEWVENGKYYVDPDGKWVKGAVA